ncbi:hypothetical protein [Frondihabitans australicus]|uniref:Uncharacterized protein n=1 Tax=Frondihabitans australicus TaxID=386892 RepID=A0A495IBK1_9MICO|nr:hypothetical protein [Frondihabitans australicus]RKR73299.1 hypothetical protein C8E83_0391 [Frondihabitans australicus]
MAAERTRFPDGTPARFTIVPDDYHVPFAGTTGDGRRFFASDELFESSLDGSRSFVAVFFWTADGSFDSIDVRDAERPDGAPPAQGLPTQSEGVLDEMLLALGDYVLEPIEVEPFSEQVRDVTFGFVPTAFDGVVSITVQPGDFIAYYEPWDGEEYDT